MRDYRDITKYSDTGYMAQHFAEIFLQITYDILIIL